LSEVIDLPINDLNFVAVVSKVKKHLTKNNKEMAFIVLEDEFNSIDGVVFPNIYEKTNFEIGKVYQVKGKFDLQKQRQSVIIDEIRLLRE
jgi:DNA polymerase III alpha subunit